MLVLTVFSIRKVQRFSLRTQDGFATTADSIVEQVFSKLCLVFHDAGVRSQQWAPLFEDRESDM